MNPESCNLPSYYSRSWFFPKILSPDIINRLMFLLIRLHKMNHNSLFLKVTGNSKLET